MSLFNKQITNLYYKDAKNMIRHWFIYQDVNDIVIKHGVLNGAMQEQRETINIGKAARSLQQQIDSRINSRINKQELKGYKRSIALAEKGATNILDLPKPMLAQPFNKIKNIDLLATLVQYKYNGHRCLVTNQNGKIIAYSRNGKIIDTIGHILDDLPILEGLTLDGELYCHGMHLQQISSLVKRKQPDTLKLKYHIYDVIADEPFRDRMTFLMDLDFNSASQLVPCWTFDKMGSVKAGLKHAKEQGYEGLILRTNDTKYETAKRSKSLIKVKSFLDDEFVVVDITLSEKKFPVLHCLAKNGKVFKAVIPGTREQKLEVYNQKENYIGESVNVEFSEYTKDNVPFHAVAVYWRNKGNE